MNKKVNLSECEEFNRSFTSYADLIEYYRQFSEKYYKERNFYFEKHHIIPRCEDKRSTETVCLDLAHHAIAHFLRAKEYEKAGNQDFAYKNYYAVQKIIGAFVSREETSIPQILLDHAAEIKQKTGEAVSAQFKECVYFTNGKENHRVRKDKIEEFIKAHPSFKKGRTFKNPTGKLWIYKDQERLYLPVEEAEQYIKEHPGWQMGMGSTSKHVPKLGYFKGTTTGKKWMHKDGERRNVATADIPSFLANGWIMGHGNPYTNLGKKALHKGEKMINVPAQEVPRYLEMGWEMGRTELWKAHAIEAKSRRKNENSQT